MATPQNVEPSCHVKANGADYVLSRVKSNQVRVINLTKGADYYIGLAPNVRPICSCPDACFRANPHCKHVALLEEYASHIGVDLRQCPDFERPAFIRKAEQQPRNPDFCPGSEVAGSRHGWVHVNVFEKKAQYWVCSFCGCIVQDEQR